LIAHVPFDPFVPFSRYHSQTDDDRSLRETTTLMKP
jgi:hypothetical protein